MGKLRLKKWAETLSGEKGNYLKMPSFKTTDYAILEYFEFWL